MRKLLGEAAEALWHLVTSPLRQLLADAYSDALKRQSTLAGCPEMDTGGPGLIWHGDDDGDGPQRYDIVVPRAWTTGLEAAISSLMPRGQYARLRFPERP